MTAYNVLNKLARARDADRASRFDPGSGETIIVSPVEFSTVVLTGAGARTLQDADDFGEGTSVLCISQTNAITVNSVTINDGEHVEFKVTLNSSAAKAWVQTDHSNTQGDIDALEALRYKTFTEELDEYEFRVHDALGTRLSAGAGATDDLGVTVGVIGVSAPTLNATVDDAALTQEGVLVFQVPQDYVAGANLTLSVDFTRTAAADTTATLDAEVYRHADPTTDIAGAAAPATDINSAASGTITWTITGTNVVPGEKLDIRLIAAIDDSGGATAPAVFEFDPSLNFVVADQS